MSLYKIQARNTNSFPLPSLVDKSLENSMPLSLASSGLLSLSRVRSGRPSGSQASKAARQNAMRDEIERDITTYPICMYGKGSKDKPLCRFTIKAIDLFEKYQVPFFFQDIHDNPEKMQALNAMTHHNTLPKIFIKGQFYGGAEDVAKLDRSGKLSGLLTGTADNKLAGI